MRIVIPQIDVTQVLADARKFQVALVGALGEVLALGLLHGNAEHYTQVALTVATAVGVYLTPNSPKDIAKALQALEGTRRPAAGKHEAA